MSIVELRWAPVKPDSENSAAAASLKTLGDKMLNAAGLEASYHGKGVSADEPHAVEIVNVWASEAAQAAAQSGPESAEAKKLFAEVLDTSNPKLKPYSNIIHFDGAWGPVADAAVTQVTAVFVSVDTPKADFDKAWSAVAGAIGGKPDGFVAGVKGWANNSIDEPELGGKVNVFVAASGWESIDKAKASVTAYSDKFEDMKKFSKHYHQRHVKFTKLK